jgi:sec-independent protein translocase protein TatA
VTSGLITPTHIAFLLVVLLLMFGAKRLPETGRALGRGIREFKEAITGRDTDTSQRQAVAAPTTSPQDTTPTRGGTS